MPLNLRDVGVMMRMDDVEVLSHAQTTRCEPGLVDLFEHMTDAVHVADCAGRVVYQNRRLVRIMDEEPDACRLFDELGRVVSCLSSRAAQLHCVDRSFSAASRAMSSSTWCELRTDSALYRLHGTLIGSRSSSTTATLAVVVIAILGNAGAPSAEHLRARYGLSPREVEVARLLADGLSTRELSAALRVSSHTARHHTENVLRKLRVRRRAEVGRRLRGG
ncbi:MAG TPA: LuxR C-terminal-related transcriptional regulator [Gemmatimonadaceae bacterium]|nr:LuxR C-terminal-related transcriptional regulator [Gemmatimonadaceae bacterium]